MLSICLLFFLLASSIAGKMKHYHPLRLQKSHHDRGNYSIVAIAPPCMMGKQTINFYETKPIV